jgi:hypothetical protein
MIENLRMVIARWTDVCTSLQTIQEELKEYYIALEGVLLSGSPYNFSENLDSLQHYPDKFVIDCTGYHSCVHSFLMRDTNAMNYVNSIKK